MYIDTSVGHGGQSVPPQSTLLSSLFFTPSPHEPGTNNALFTSHTTFTLTNIAVSPTPLDGTHTHSSNRATQSLILTETLPCTILTKRTLWTLYSKCAYHELVYTLCSQREWLASRILIDIEHIYSILLSSSMLYPHVCIIAAIYQQTFLAVGSSESRLTVAGSVCVIAWRGFILRHTTAVL